METYESVLLVKPEVFIYKIPPSGNNRRHRYVVYRIGFGWAVLRKWESLVRATHTFIALGFRFC